MRNHWKGLLIALAAMALLLAACGPQTVEAEVTMTDFAFDPADLTVPAGAEVTLILINEGSVEHEWVLMEQGYTAEPPFTEEDEANILWEGEVPADESETFTFTAPAEPGEYQVVCGIEGHFEAGMVGTLTVE